MSLTLALVTCGPQLEVALAGDGMAAVSVVRLGGGSPRSTLLMAAVDLVLEDAGREPADVATVLVTRGPGSFTGIRAGLATAAGLAAAVGCAVEAHDSLTVQAARLDGPAEAWAAQPGRRGELYARRYRLEPGAPPVALGGIEIVAVDALPADGTWLAAEAVDLGARLRGPAVRTAAEALVVLATAGAPPQPLEPLYVEPPPVHGQSSPEAP